VLRQLCSFDRFALAAAIFLVFKIAAADVIPPHIAALENRMRENPDLFDRHDNFCSDKKPKDDCLIPGSRLAGGGNGLCRRSIDSAASTIDLSCELVDNVSIFRDLPPGGFVPDSRTCESPQTAEQLSRTPYPCKPQVAPYVDRFCRGKAVGDACAVELSVDGAKESNAGSCQKVTEKEGYYLYGRRIATRETIRCEAAEPVKRTFSNISSLRKLLQ